MISGGHLFRWRTCGAWEGWGGVGVVARAMSTCRYPQPLTSPHKGRPQGGGHKGEATRGRGTGPLYVVGAAYLTIFCRINAVRRSVTGSRLAGPSDGGPSDAPSRGSSRKDDDKSNDLVRRPCCCLRKT